MQTLRHRLGLAMRSPPFQKLLSTYVDNSILHIAEKSKPFETLVENEKTV